MGLTDALGCREDVGIRHWHNVNAVIKVGTIDDLRSPRLRKSELIGEILSVQRRKKFELLALRVVQALDRKSVV